MELSPKAIRFLIDALQEYEANLERRLEKTGADEGDAADLMNDRLYVSALRQDLQSQHEELLKARSIVPSGT